MCGLQIIQFVSLMPFDLAQPGCLKYNMQDYIQSMIANDYMIHLSAKSFLGFHV